MIHIRQRDYVTFTFSKWEKEYAEEEAGYYYTLSLYTNFFYKHRCKLDIK